MQLSKLGFTLSLLLAGGTLAQADETDAVEILRAMSDYLSAQDSFGFEYDSTLEIVTTDDQKLGIASSGQLNLARPNKLHATRTGGYSDVEIGFDGSSFVAIGRNAGLAVKQDFTGSIDDLFNELRTRQALPFPAADLLYANSFDILMEDVVDIKDLGVGVVGGQLCDHLAFRTQEVDWQIWIAHGETPYPCRFEISQRTLSQAPGYRIDLKNWQDDVMADADIFQLTIPDTVKLVEFVDFDAAAGHLPPHFTKGDTQ